MCVGGDRHVTFILIVSNIIGYPIIIIMTPPSQVPKVVRHCGRTMRNCECSWMPYIFIRLWQSFCLWLGHLESILALYGEGCTSKSITLPSSFSFPLSLTLFVYFSLFLPCTSLYAPRNNINQIKGWTIDIFCSHRPMIKIFLNLQPFKPKVWTQKRRLVSAVHDTFMSCITYCSTLLEH